MITALPFAGGAPPLLHAGRCLNRRHAGAQCTRCVAGCPVQALTLDGPTPQLDAAGCVRCGLCLQICPTDVFTPEFNYETRLYATVDAFPQAPLALVCGAHPSPEVIAAPVGAVVQHRRCLASLAAADLLELNAGGRRPLWLDDSPCAACTIGVAQATLQRTVDEARTLLQAAGRPPTLLLQSERPPAPSARARRLPLHDGAQPAISRRALLSRLRPAQPSEEGEPPLDEVLQRGAPMTARLPQQLPVSRRRLLTTLTALETVEDDAFDVDRSSFAAVQVDNTRCSACGLCARFCPTGALQFDGEGDHFQLRFQPAACVACGICAAACPEAAVGFGASLTLAALLSEEVLPLAEGALVPCSVCGVPTAPLPGDTLLRCHVCRHGAGVVTSLRDDAGLMADLLTRIPQQPKEKRP